MGSHWLPFYMFNKLKSYFNYSASERNGLIFLLLLILCAIAVVCLGDYLTNNADQFKSLDLSSMLEPSTDSGLKHDSSAFLLQNFDPNELDEQGWIRLGFSQKQARSILKYRAKAGRFKEPEDLLKLYVIDSARFNMLEPFIHIRKESPTEKRLSVLDINSCDSIELVKLPGIGKVRAHKIIKFRDLLGGFCKKEQVLETYGIDTIVYVQFQAQITVKELSWVMIDLNSADYEELEKHPYISKKAAESIIFHRETVGLFLSNNDIVNMDLISENLYVKLQPYLIPIE